MSARALRRLGGWEWRSEPDKIILPASHADEKCVRVHYRKDGARVFRSFLLLGYDGAEPADAAIVAAIAEHAAS